MYEQNVLIKCDLKPLTKAKELSLGRGMKEGRKEF